MSKKQVAVAEGDGTGPEIVKLAVHILKEAGAEIEWLPIAVGKKVFDAGNNTGIEPEAWDAIRSTGVVLKGPMQTPLGRREKSVDVTIGKALGLYATIRAVKTYAPVVCSRYPAIDVVIVRENEEDLYAGVEHRQTDEVMQCLKLISRPGCEKIARYAFEYAVRNRRRKITCVTKDDVMKITDGLFHKVFDEVAQQYSHIECSHMMLEAGVAKMAADPQELDVVLAPNMYAELLSIMAAQQAGGIGLYGAVSLGEAGAVFESMQGALPELAGKNVVNPVGILQAAVAMLLHIRQPEPAERIQNALFCVLEQGLHTPDITCSAAGARVTGTAEFARAVAANLGKKPQQMQAALWGIHSSTLPPVVKVEHAPAAVKTLVGVDVFLHWHGEDPQQLGECLRKAGNDDLQLIMITNRGVKVWPAGMQETYCTDHWRCRFAAANSKGSISNQDIIALMSRVDALGLDFIKCENLCNFNGEPGFALGQGQS